MGLIYNASTYEYKTAKELLTDRPEYAGRDGYYVFYPNGPNDSSTRQYVYCDMTTDGGGWMLIARSHPTTVNYNGQNWGWRGGKIGDVKDFSQAYQAGWWTYWNGNSTFTEYIYGNRANINNNAWGPFIYKVGISNYTTFTTSDVQQSASSYAVLKTDTNVQSSTAFPTMQNQIGYPITGTANNNYYMRDCCGYSSYGATPTFMQTTYCANSDVYVNSPGPWCGGSTTDGSGNFLSNTVTVGSYKYGGTNQYMIMVR